MKKTSFLVSCLFVALAHSQDRVPDPPPATASEQVFHAWLDAFNSADLDRLADFHRRYGGDGARDLRRDLDMRERTGGFELQSLEKIERRLVVALLRERGSARWARLQIELSEDEPPRVLGMRLQPAAPPTDATREGTAATEAEALGRVQSFLDSQAAAGRFSGVALVARNGEVVFERSYGLADRSRQIANTPDTRFRIASMNKMFTAVAVLQLAESGRLALSDPLVKFLPDYPNRDLAGKVTVEQLLTHRGGTGDFFGPEYFASKDRIRTLDDYIGLVGSRPAAFEPGARFQYSNFGYILLGAIIEKVSGRSYYEYVQAEVFSRAGMTRSGSEPEERQVESLSVGYTRASPREQWQANTRGLPYRGTPAGGGYSTARDLLAFAQALPTGKLLGAAYTERMMQDFAWRDALGGGTGYVGHNGGAPGMNGDLRLYPSSGYVIVVLANLDPPAAEAVTDLLDVVLPRESPAGNLRS